MSFNNESSVAGSSRSLNRNISSPTSNHTEDPTFWVPAGTSGTGHCSDIHSDDSDAQTPTSPTSSNRSFALSNYSIPIVRSDKHIVLATTSPARPKMASMQAKLDHTKIDTSLYKNSPQKLPSLSSQESRGTLHFCMLYDPIAGILTIRLIEAQDLQPRDFSGTADPYAKVRLLPDATKTNMWQTRIHKRTLNPVFDEDFVFEVRPATIGRRTLEILLYDFDAYSRHVCIGGLKIQLAHVDLSDKVELWKSLGPCDEQDAKVELGDLMISLSYLPSAERLTAVVSIIHNGKRLKKKKTAVLRNTVNPVFNEALTFDIVKDTLKHSVIEFLVMHDSLLGANELLGRALVGNSHEVRVEDKQFFDEIFRTKTATAQWISLSDPRSSR
ncbi:CLUMA_CG015761, isoform A [Clunio marinus]|uniref:CLUMA_CG015761, isoform A n=1 Tax=Clunio marinus TaxID=568069 RepID=A0A1J1IVX1_9DIPT|nr:CLUMA_CG015761, isoform A [Clunio marinus]